MKRQLVSTGGKFMLRITARRLREMTRCLRAGDVVFLPRQLDAYDTKWVAAEVRRRGLIGSVLSEDFREAPDAALVMMLQTMFESSVETKKFWPRRKSFWEPPWGKRLPGRLLGAMRRQACEMGARSDVMHVMDNFPTAGVEYVILEDGLACDVIVSLRLFRLNNIRQLGNLQDPCVGTEAPEFVPRRYEHTRYMHVLDTMAIATIVAHNCRLAPRERSHLRASALIHDALMPAHGDETKMLDPAAFDEDLNIGNLLNGPDWEGLRERRGLSRQLLIDTVQGRGSLGSLLDLCDKIAYVARDVGVYLGRPFNGDGPLGFEDGYVAIREHLRLYPASCHVWQDIGLRGGRVFFADATRLGTFLKLRVMMFRELYYNPAARFSAFIVSHVLSRYLYEQGKLTRDDLIRMTDLNLDEIFDKLSGRPYLIERLAWEDCGPRSEAFATLEAAQRRERELIAQGIPLTLIEDMSGKIKPATSRLVRHQGRLVPYREVEPVMAEEIEALAWFEKPVQLYYLIEPEMSLIFKEALLAYRKRELARRNT